MKKKEQELTEQEKLEIQIKYLEKLKQDIYGDEDWERWMGYSAKFFLICMFLLGSTAMIKLLIKLWL